MKKKNVGHPEIVPDLSPSDLACRVQQTISLLPPAHNSSKSGPLSMPKALPSRANKQNRFVAIFLKLASVFPKPKYTNNMFGSKHTLCGKLREGAHRLCLLQSTLKSSSQKWERAHSAFRSGWILEETPPLFCFHRRELTPLPCKLHSPPRNNSTPLKSRVFVLFCANCRTKLATNMFSLLHPSISLLERSPNHTRMNLFCLYE